MINPLDSDQQFQLTLCNPNPTSSKSKDGPKYRVSFEVDREMWDNVMDADTVGMVIEAMAVVTHSNAALSPKRDPDTVDAGEKDKEKGGAISQNSDILARDPRFHEYLCYMIEKGTWGAVTGVTNNNTETARKYIRYICGVRSRAELDHNEEAAVLYQQMKSDFLRWINAIA